MSILTNWVFYRSISHHKDTNIRDIPHHLGAPPPLISPKSTPRDAPRKPPTTLWNPVSLISSPSTTRRVHELPYPPNRPPPGLIKPEYPDRCLSPKVHRLQESGNYVPEPEKPNPNSVTQQRLVFPMSGIYGEIRGIKRPGSPNRGFSQKMSRAVEPMVVYDVALQQHRTLLSKLDLEEKKRREAREKGRNHTNIPIALCKNTCRVLFLNEIYASVQNT